MTRPAWPSQMNREIRDLSLSSPLSRASPSWRALRQAPVLSSPSSRLVSSLSPSPSPWLILSPQLSLALKPSFSLLGIKKDELRSGLQKLHRRTCIGALRSRHAEEVVSSSVCREMSPFVTEEVRDRPRQNWSSNTNERSFLDLFIFGRDPWCHRV